jgi:hypothetical protein
MKNMEVKHIALPSPEEPITPTMSRSFVSCFFLASRSLLIWCFNPRFFYFNVIRWLYFSFDHECSSQFTLVTNFN